MDLKNIGQAIAARRSALKLRQEDLAEMSGLTVRTIYNVEHGSGNPAIETLLKICGILGLEINLQVKKIAE